MHPDLRRSACAGSSTTFTGGLGSLLLLAGLSSLGCKGKASSAHQPPGVACAIAATAYVGRHTVELNVGDQLPAMAETAIAECEQKQWTQPVRICLRDAQDAAGSEACFTDRGQLVHLMDVLHLRRVALPNAPVPVTEPPRDQAPPTPSPTTPTPL